ncbi:MULTISPECIES: hypothetical protein [Moorena]|nr:MULTISPECIES: hypothetical protein [Moorena]NEP36409.1 hypothetical protein [Moorena sp. SIO3B2]NEP64814.1 hypothetical protein [Moorena sp. SIO3A5]NEQ07214.1 hypothetical protein [Moorena sp. SIO4E2]NES41956.1 hypothetical protein [Moorena sp. SIO2C4]
MPVPPRCPFHNKMPVPQQDAHSKSLSPSRIDQLKVSLRNYGGLHNYQVHKIFFPLPCSHFRLPCSLLPAPCSLKTDNEST